MSTRAEMPRAYVLPVVRELPPQWPTHRLAEPAAAERAPRTSGEEAQR